MTEGQAVIVAAAQSPYRRSPGAGTTTEGLLVDAFVRVLADAGLRREDVDGLAVVSFTLGPDHAIDLAWKLGLRLRWILQDTTGGAAGVNMLVQAARAIEAGDAHTVVVLGGDRLLAREVLAVNDGYNVTIRDHLAPIPLDGPNTLFSFVTQHHAAQHGLARGHYGRVAITQRHFAAGNPGAVYRRPLTMAEYLAAPPVSPPLHRFDCPPIVNGADAFVVRARSLHEAGPGVTLRAARALHNFDGQDGDGTVTGLASLADELWAQAGLGPADVDTVQVYDDYPVMVLIQLDDLGFVDDGDLAGFIERRLGARDPMAVNTSGGLLSAGQAGGGSGLLGVGEAFRQLTRRAGARQVEGARTALVSGYGMVVHRYGACSNAAVLERVA